MKKNPLTYAIILNYNGYADTIKCISSILKATYNNLQLIIVDNNSSDNSIPKIVEVYPEINIIAAAENKGYAAGMNIGAKYALENGADLILLANNDMLFPPNFLEPLVNRIISDDKMGIISPKVLYTENSDLIYSAGGEFKLSRCGGVNLYQGKNSYKFGNEPKELSLAEGACMLIKREVYETIGYMNENYFMYFEDLEFSFRVRQKFKIFYEPKSIVYHKSGAGNSWSSYSPLYYYYYTRNRLLFFSDLKFRHKIFALIFTLLNTSAKSIVLLYTLISDKNRSKTLKSLRSIWKGTFDGLKYLINPPSKLTKF
jgi:GT2 family glycosyltransferase